MAYDLLEAARQGQCDRVAELLAAGADVNAADVAGRTHLLEAATGGHDDVVQLLLAAGAAWKAANSDTSFTPLYGAALSGHTSVVQLLLDALPQVEPPLTAAHLITAASTASTSQHMATFACVLKALWQLHPTEAMLYVQWLCRRGYPAWSSAELAAVLDEWASDVSSFGRQRAALRTREEAVAAEKQAVQQLIVAVAGMAQQQVVAVQQSLADKESREGPRGAVWL
jgi:hypothetical protein